MTSTTTRVFDEIAKLMTNAAGAAQGVRREIDQLVQTRVERALNEIEVVRREDFEVVRDIAIKAREENEALKKRLEALEKQLRPAARKAAPKSGKRPAGKSGKKT